MYLMFSLPVGYSSASLEVATLEQLCLDAEERKESEKGQEGSVVPTSVLESSMVSLISSYL